MNIKVRFAILFTSFVSLILIISSLTIYFLYANFRVEDYYTRMNKETLVAYNSFIDHYPNVIKTQTNQEKNEQNLIDFFILVYDSTQKRIYQSTDSIVKDPPKLYFFKTLLNSETRFTKNGRDAIMFYFADTGYYVFASAQDIFGLRKLRNIRIILITVLLGGFFLSGLGSLVFVRHAFKPLQNLSNQMLLVDDVRNAQPVIVGKANDEINLIAKSYNSMIERLKQTFEYQHVFVNHASHELRTPLAVMLSQTEAALNNQLTEGELKKVLQSLKEDQQDMIELTNALLLLSQYEKEHIKKRWDNIRIDELIYECIEVAKKAFPNIEISFNFINVPEENDLLIPANKSLLGTAMKNLIKNGYQYSYDKKIKISLLVNESNTEITFENNGKEVPQEQRDQLFVPFFRAKNVDMEMGYGLGLAIVLRIVQAHEGEIIYKVCDTGKNCFTILLHKQKPVE